MAKANYAQDGDYTKSPPTGFWPDYLSFLNDSIVQQYRPYNPNFIGFERVNYPVSVSSGVLGGLISNQIDTTDSYFLLDSTYNGLGRSRVFTPTCSTSGVDSTFFTLPSTGDDTPPMLSDSAIAGIAIGAFLLVVGSVFIGIVIYRERQGKPMFSPLIDQDQEEEENKNFHNRRDVTKVRVNSRNVQNNDNDDDEDFSSSL